MPFYSANRLLANVAFNSHYNTLSAIPSPHDPYFVPPCIQRKFRFTMILHALFGADTWRFSAMLASFSFIYKFLLNALPLIPIPDALAILRSSRHNRLRRRELDDFLESGESFTTPPSGLSTGQQTPLLMMQSKQRRQLEALAGERRQNEEEKEEPERQGRGSHLSMQSRVVYSRLDGARWHAVVAGAIAGLSVLWEKKSRRITIAQQLFVRQVKFEIWR